MPRTRGGKKVAAPAPAISPDAKAAPAPAKATEAPKKVAPAAAKDTAHLSKAKAPTVEAEINAKPAAEEEPVLIKCDFAPPPVTLSVPEPEQLELAPAPEKLELAREASSDADTTAPKDIVHVTSDSTCATEALPGESKPTSHAELKSEAICRVSAVCSSTEPGQVLALVGSDPALGAWDTAKALELVTSAETFPTWSVDVHDALGPGVEFKLIIKSADGVVTWEPMEHNRTWASVPDMISATWGEP